MKNALDGIYQYFSDNNTILNNLIKANEDGIDGIDSKYSVISSNQIIANRQFGVHRHEAPSL